ncbi:hypothetical protein JFT60_12560 [Pseudomonas sp. MF6772]|nr:hypothetical protein [Pseudomonas sp. MF6772]
MNDCFAYFHNCSLSRFIRLNRLESQLFFCASIANCHLLVEHPDHDLLFVATQVARAAGLKDPKGAVNKARHLKKQGHNLMALVAESATSLPTGSDGKKLRSTTVFFSEPDLYAMLLRGHAPASEPFRKWVTEEVLPTIRKTGKYNAEDSTNPIFPKLLAKRTRRKRRGCMA